MVVVSMIIMAFIDQFFQRHVSDNIYSGLVSVALGAIGGIGVENAMTAFKEMKRLGIKVPDSSGDDDDDTPPHAAAVADNPDN